MSVGTDVWYPPAGLALALLMGLGVSYAPLIFVSGFLTSAINYLLPVLGGNIWYVNGVIAVWYGGVAIVLRRYFQVDGAFRSLQEVGRRFGGSVLFDSVSSCPCNAVASSADHAQ